MATVTATRRPRARPGRLTREWVTAVAGGIADTNIRAATTKQMGRSRYSRAAFDRRNEYLMRGRAY